MACSILEDASAKFALNFAIAIELDGDKAHARFDRLFVSNWTATCATKLISRRTFFFFRFTFGCIHSSVDSVALWHPTVARINRTPLFNGTVSSQFTMYTNANCLLLRHRFSTIACSFSRFDLKFASLAFGLNEIDIVQCTTAVAATTSEAAEAKQARTAASM